MSGERAGLVYRLTHVLNVLVWKLPLPRRIAARLSALVYRSPPMTPQHVHAALDALAAAGARVHVTGGWGVDAMLGRQERTHRDLDLVVEAADLEIAEKALAELGYEEWNRHDDERPMFTRVVVRDRALRVIDLHPEDLASLDLQYASGTIDGRFVPCLSASVQIEQHSGYRKRRRDHIDLRLLRRVLLGPVTALVVPVMDADAFVDHTARDKGMPPHITVLYPFVSGRALDPKAERDLADLLRRTPAFTFTLDEVDGFPGVVHLPPKPSEPFVQLTREIANRWPDHQPYGGEFEEIIPHLTVARGDEPPPGLDEQLPLRTRAEEVWLMSRQGGEWFCRTRFPLGQAEPEPPVGGGSGSGEAVA
jgi:hypothetical protein